MTRIDPESSELRYAPRVYALEPAHVACLGSEGSAGGLDGALHAVAHRRLPVLLDSAAGEPRRWSLLAFDPLVETVWGSAELQGDPRGGSALGALREALGRIVAQPDELAAIPGPFQGGWIGALSYDLGVVGETLDLPSEPWELPLVVGGLYTDFLVRDEESGEAWIVLDERPERPAQVARDELLSALSADAGAAQGIQPTGALVRDVTGAEHCARIERAREWIAAGEIYQANLAHRFTRAMDGEPSRIYARLRAHNPAPYMAFVDWSSSAACLSGRARPGALLSSSPELLVEFDGETARTRPIKGTLPRGSTDKLDRANARALLASEKDRAELGMIVDLERNDLGRVAQPGRVWVDGFPTLESYATVHHLVADVSAQTRAGVDAFELLAALFPGGSITGAPKLRSMEVIAELEQEGRGFFTGSLGFVSLDGSAAFNILIRTLLWRPREAKGGATRGEVSFRVGGGITWSSNAADEERETLHKGAALARSLAGEGETSALL